MDKLPHLKDIKKNHSLTMRKHMRELIVRMVSEAVAHKKNYINTHSMQIDAALVKELNDAGLNYSKLNHEITW